MSEQVRALTGFTGVARTYEFNDDGELVGAEPGLYVAAGTRWISVPP